MLLGTYYSGVELHREDKIVFARFLTPHRVISTCPVCGGLRDDLLQVYNHQVCEPSGHLHPRQNLAIADPASYHRLVCEEHGLNAENCATLGTAANMNCLAVVEDSYRDLEVIAACTGGVETNAGRAGDPAPVYECDGRFVSVEGGDPVPVHGTINTILFISEELTPGAMVRAVMTATEAKTAALQDLAIGSRYSEGLATGTGTDQIAVASRLTGRSPLTWAGKHTKLGELIGRTIRNAVKRTLALQNGITPLSRCSVLAHLERFGVERRQMVDGVGSSLNPEMSRIFEDNFVSIDRDPLTVAAVAALVHLRDELSSGILPEGCRPEILCSYGAQIAAAVASKPELLPRFRSELSSETCTPDTAWFLRLVFQSVALGFQHKW